ncbi:MAG: hypothetical protein HOQ45_01790 [Nocardioidaceae bacterium]|nr:hypothetical protein [Nocardioidaceae bacterium]
MLASGEPRKQQRASQPHQRKQSFGGAGTVVRRGPEQRLDPGRPDQGSDGEDAADNSQTRLDPHQYLATHIGLPTEGSSTNKAARAPSCDNNDPPVFTVVLKTDND